VRARYLKLIHDNGVKWVFAGHLHQNRETRDGEMQMVATGPVGMPLNGAKSGIRIVSVTADGLKHKYFELGEIPETLELK
jgi:serine/threonine-protein phosphatase CPPED1